VPDARIIPIGGDNGSGPTGSGRASDRSSANGRRRAASPAPEPQRAPDADARPDSDEAYRGLPGGGYEPPSWDERVAGTLAFLRRRMTGDYSVDEFGFDPELQEKVLLAPLRPLYEKWFRVETRGLEHVPDTGGALVVANHSGTIAVDSVMTQIALLDHHPAHPQVPMR